MQRTTTTTSELLELNDRIALELADGFSDADLKKYELEPPRVIVVGLTSAGKSSLLERLIGHSIFPVRDNVCTRRPFRVLLRKNAEVTGTEFCFSAKPHNETTYALPDELDAVRESIAAQQDSDSDAVSFSNAEIHAEIRSRDNQTFAFTDLPGIFLVSVGGASALVTFVCALFLCCFSVGGASALVKFVCVLLCYCALFCTVFCVAHLKVRQCSCDVRLCSLFVLLLRR
jgi:hypothetical protein